MSLHHRNAHGRAFFGEEALHFLASRKRDSHGDHVMMNVPAGFAPPVEKAVVIQTLVSQVFVTLPQSFTGTAAGLHTVAAGAPANTGARTTQRDSESTPTGRPSADRGQSQQIQPTNHRHETTTASWNQATQSASFSGTVTAAYDPDATYYTNTPGNTGANSSAIYGQSTSDKAANNVSQDLPLAVKAGIAVGAVVGFALLGVLLFFCLRRRKSSSGGDNNEKHGSIFGAQQDVPQPYSMPQATPRTASAAPRLSLRPVTQFLPNLAENRKSGDILNGMTGGGAKSAWQRQPASENPFADNNMREKSRPMTPNGNPFDDRQGLIASAAVPANASPTRNPNQHNQFSQGSDRSVIAAPAAAVVANGPSQNDSGRVSPPSQRGPNNVHRVQLDFKPSMDDELELRSGQLVRMLHEYDDGWALCVRMDRSQQGVCPRTCLSKLPVKPRQGPPGNARPYSPNAGPNSNGQRTNSPSPTGPASRPQIPAAATMRPDSSQMFNPNGMFPRPLTPTGNTERAESPDPLRKPVPGQAF